MSKNKVFIAGILVIVIVSGMMLTGCTTTKHHVEISNVSANNIREVYIRNAGTTFWGTNLVKDLQDMTSQNIHQLWI